jgi:hypothetical protein
MYGANFTSDKKFQVPAFPRVQPHLVENHMQGRKRLKQRTKLLGNLNCRPLGVPAL